MPVKSIADIAQLAGVAKTTVSAVLNGRSEQYRISPKTQEKILGIVKEHNYRPNRVARSLRTNKTYSIGLIVPDLTNCFFSDLTTSIEAIAREAGYQVLIASSEDEKETEIKVIENFMDFSVDGMIIASTLDDDELKSLITAEIPVVFIDREIPGNNYFSVTSDHYKGAREVISILAEDCDEIAFIGRGLEISSAKDRYRAYEDVLKKNKISLNKDMIRFTPDLISNGKKSLENIENKLGRLPKGLYTSSYVLLMGCLEYLSEQYGEIPSDLKIATFDNTRELDFINVKIHSVSQDCLELAKASFSALMSYMSGKPKAATVTINPKVIRR